jgi:2-methylcitrate dehydratase PrpD
MAAPNSGFTRELARYTGTLTYDSLPLDVVKQAKKVILDALTGQAACSQLENGRLIVQFGQALGGTLEASVFGGHYRTSAVNAALVNGTLGHGDEIDESLEEIGHASAVIIPAAFSCGEKEARSGKELIAAVVAGYDVAGRLVHAGLVTSRLTRGLSTALLSAFPGTAAACSMLKLNLTQTQIAFGLTASQAGGFYDMSSESKHGAKSAMRGFVARDSVTAALMAQIGYDGPQSPFDGPSNVFDTFVGTGYDAAEMTLDLGQRFPIMETCLKLYSAGHPIHAPADGLLKIMAREGLSAGDIKSIVARQPFVEQRTVDNREMPEICIQYCLAVAAFDRKLTWDQYTPERESNPQVLDLKKRVRSIADPVLEERKKTTKAHSAEVDVETMDGRKFTERVDYPPGDPGNPATQEQIEQKALHYASRVLGKEKAERIIAMVNALESVTDLNRLGDLLRIDRKP